MRIALCGLFGGGNLGNEGSLEAMIQRIKEVLPAAELLGIGLNPENISRRYGIAATAFSTRPFGRARGVRGWRGVLLRAVLLLPGEAISWYRILSRMRTAQALVFPGTGILDDFGLEPGGVPYDILRWCLAARIWGARIYFVSIGAGPIGNRVSRWLMGSAARLAHYRSFRDEQSRDFLKGLGLDTQEDHVCPDIAFALRPARPGAIARGATGRATIGFGVMSYYGWSDRAEAGGSIYGAYLAKVVTCLATLLEEGHDVRLLVGDVDVDRRALDDVLVALGGPGRRGPDAGALHSSPIGSIDDLLREIALVDIVVATRFHNVVCALIQGRPTISCGYAEKNRTLLSGVGLGHYSQPVGDLDVSLLLEQVHQLLAERERHEERMAATVAEYRRRIVHEVGCVIEELARSSSRR